MSIASSKETEIQRIADAITSAIAEQRLPPGTRLIESQLVNSLNANRNHVRSALQRLALRRIVSLEANCGASVARPTVQESRDIFAARSVVERGIIEILVRDLRQIDAPLLKKQVQQEQKAIESGCREDIIRESGQFHILLAKLCRNTVLQDVLKDLITQSSLILSLYQRHNEPQCGCNEHTEIIQAIEQKDVEAAIAAMRHHLHDIELNLNLDFWESKKVDFDQIFKD